MDVHPAIMICFVAVSLILFMCQTVTLVRRIFSFTARTGSNLPWLLLSSVGRAARPPPPFG